MENKILLLSEVECKHKKISTTNDGNRTQKCVDCGKYFVKDGIVYDTPKKPVLFIYGAMDPARQHLRN